MDWIGLAQLFIGTVGLIVICYQIMEVRDSLKAQIRNIQAQTLSQLYDQYFEICRLFADKPFLRPYFYDSQRFKEGTDKQDQRSEITAVCELITGLLEHAAVQRENVPPQTWERCWLPYLKDMYDNSAELELFYRSHRHFYTEEFCKNVDAHLASREGKKPRAAAG
jgi:hypothetical protein